MQIVAELLSAAVNNEPEKEQISEHMDTTDLPIAQLVPCTRSDAATQVPATKRRSICICTYERQRQR